MHSHRVGKIFADVRRIVTSHAYENEQWLLFRISPLDRLAEVAEAIEASISLTLCEAGGRLVLGDGRRQRAAIELGQRKRGLRLGSRQIHVLSATCERACERRHQTKEPSSCAD